MKRLQLRRVRKLKLYRNLSLSCCPFQSYPALKCNIMQHVVKQSHSPPKCEQRVLPTFFGGSVNGYNCDDPVNGALVEAILVALSVESRSSRALEKRSFR